MRVKSVYIVAILMFFALNVGNAKAFSLFDMFFPSSDKPVQNLEGVENTYKNTSNKTDINQEKTQAAHSTQEKDDDINLIQQDKRDNKGPINVYEQKIPSQSWEFETESIIEQSVSKETVKKIKTTTRYIKSLKTVQEAVKSIPSQKPKTKLEQLEATNAVLEEQTSKLRHLFLLYLLAPNPIRKEAIEKDIQNLWQDIVQNIQQAKKLAEEIINNSQ